MDVSLLGAVAENLVVAALEIIYLMIDSLVKSRTFCRLVTIRCATHAINHPTTPSLSMSMPSLPSWTE